MNEPNPYESPKADGPRTRSRWFKRGIGVGLILLLTPVAMAIAIWTCFTLAPRVNVPDFALVYAVPWSVLVALCVGAISAHVAYLGGQASRRFIGIMVAVPIAAIVTILLGWGLAFIAAGVWYTYDLFWLGLVTFYAPPVLVIGGMLIAAWKESQGNRRTADGSCRRSATGQG
jgi:hypothetical protein